MTSLGEVQLLDGILFAIQNTANLIFGIIGPCIVLIILIYVFARLLNQATQTALGRVYCVLYFPGCVIHELSHAFFALIFGHKITKIVLVPSVFDPQPRVEHRFNPRNIIHMIGAFFISTGPIIVSSALIYLLVRFLLDGDIFAPISEMNFSVNLIESEREILQLLTSLFDGTKKVIANLINPENFLNWRFYIVFYAGAVLGTAAELSWEDIKFGFFGFLFLLLIMFVLNLLLFLTYNFEMKEEIFEYAGRYSASISSIMVFTVAIQFFLWSIFKVFAAIRSFFRR